MPPPLMESPAFTSMSSTGRRYIEG
jgi:hypothetical protein